MPSRVPDRLGARWPISLGALGDLCGRRVLCVPPELRGDTFANHPDRQIGYTIARSGGDISSLRLPKGVGHEQQGRRFGVVVQSDAFLPRSAVVVAPTSTSAKPASFRPEIDIDGATSRVLVEQLGAVDPRRLGELAGHLTPQEQWGIDAALLTVLGLN